MKGAQIPEQISKGLSDLGEHAKEICDYSPKSSSISKKEAEPLKLRLGVEVTNGHILQNVSKFLLN